MARQQYNTTRSYPQLDLSGGLQVGTSHLMRKRNEVKDTKNATYNSIIGSAKRRMGYEKLGSTIQHGNDSLGAAVFRYGANNKIIVGINDSSNINANLRYFGGADYINLITTAPVNCRFNMLNDLDELYVAGASDTRVYLPLTNIDSSLNVSTSHNVFGAPASKFITEYNGSLYALNCFVNGKYYPDRFYKSSPPLGAITFIQTDQSGLLLQLRVDSVRYLKVGMSLDIYGAASEAKKVSGLTIVSVDKKNDRIGFVATQMSLADNDEIWLSGTKGTLSRFWNTDYKTPETADWERVPPSKESNPAFTGHGKNNNRLFMFTRNSFLKWDGGNLITVSNTVGCVSHETIQNIGSWTIWLHTTGVWGYNDNTGELKNLSRTIQPFIQAINQANLDKASAITVGRVYKVAVGELLPLDSVTTSTSTSSTSTSSTSTSTSSTSTSSTSTSSTSTSTSNTTTSVSTSSTSISTSTTSLSTSVSSTSLSTSSTSTSTVLSTKKVIRFCYDFDMNSWWREQHSREIRYQFNHDMNGYTKPYFTDDTGRLFRDETTNTDNGAPIPMDIELGRNNLGTDQTKRFTSALIDSENARGALVLYSIDDGPFKTLGQVTDNIQKLLFPKNNQLIEGRDVNFKFTHNDTGDPPVINGITTYFNLAEMTVSESS